MKKKDWFILIVVQIIISIAVLQCAYWMKLYRITGGVGMVDALTIWAGVITIVFLVFSVMGLMNIERKIDEVDKVKKQQEDKFKEIEEKSSAIIQSADLAKRDIVSKSEEQIKKIVNNSTARINFFDRLIAILRDPMIDRQIMGLTDLLRDVKDGEGIDVAYIYINRGHAYLAIKKMQEAYTDFSMAIDVCQKENKPSAYASMGAYYVANEKYEQSIECYQKALEIQPQSAPLCMDMGNSLAKLNRNEEAETYFLKALTYNPEMAEVYYNKSIKFMTKTGVADKDQCFAYLNKCIEINPMFVKAYINKAALLRDDGKNLEAIEELNRVIEPVFNSEFLMAILQRGISYRLTNNQPRALADFLFVSIFQPDDLQNLTNLAETYCDMGYYREAKYYAELAMDLAKQRKNKAFDIELQSVFQFATKRLENMCSVISLDDIDDPRVKESLAKISQKQ